MGKANRSKSGRTASGVNPAVAKRIAAAEKRAVVAHAAQVHNYELPALARFEALLKVPSGVPGNDGRNEIAAVHQLLTSRGWELSAVDFHEIVWDAPIDDDARRLIHSDEDYGEAIASVMTDALYEVPLFILTLPHRDSSASPEIAFAHARDLVPLLHASEAMHADDDPRAVIDLAMGVAVDVAAFDRGQVVAAAAASYPDPDHANWS